ncbi:MAG: hypothetical protein E7545_08425, partial [Ruminococcaceae bacterium]|nr:hypothetical protein [Oscillospiraceae bacterium]
MKKTLSIILSLALLLCVVVVIPAFSVSADTVEFSDYAFNTTIFDSSKYNLDATDANNQINTVTKKFWLDGGAWIGSSRKDGLFLGANKKTSSLLEYNGVSNNDLTNFEWQFDLKSGHNTSANTAYMTFYFHVGENSTISTTPTSSKNVLGVSLCGSNFSGSCQKPLSLVPLYTSDNGIRPIDYTVEKIDDVNAYIPKEGYYFNLSDFTRVSGSNTIFKDITINIKLVGRELTITVWETGKVSTAKEWTVILHRTAFNKYTPSGDIAVANNSGSGGNMFLTNMSVKSGNYESGKASVYNYDWWASNTIYQKDSSTGDWNSVNFESIYHNNSDAVQLNQNGIADRLLATKGYLPTGGVENFVWGFDYTPGRTWGGRTSFAFHIDDTSVTNGVVTTEGDTVTNYVRPYSSRKNMIAVTFCSANNNNTSIELKDGIVIQQSGANGNMTTLETESGYITKGALAYPEQVAKDLTSCNVNEKPEAVFYSVRIVYYEGTVTVYMWKRGDASTLFAVSAEIDESLVPAAGDFSIINFSNYAYLDNMFITSLDDNTTEAEAAVAHYENTYETITGKALCAHDYNGVIKVEPTYFVEGSKDLKCACGDILATNIALPATDKALDSITETFADGKLTIAWEYNDDLIVDITKGAKIYFNYEIAGYKKSVLVNGTENLSVTLEGFNADRLNSDLTYSLSAEYGDIPTAKLKTATTKTFKAADKVEEGSKLSNLLNAVKDNNDTVVSGTMINTNDFVSNTIEADIKAGTMGIRFVASPELIKKLSDNNSLARVNKIYVTIDGLETKEFTLEKLTKVTIVNISGLSFEQLYG